MELARLTRRQDFRDMTLLWSQSGSFLPPSDAPANSAPPSPAGLILFQLEFIGTESAAGLSRQTISGDVRRNGNYPSAVRRLS